MSTPRVVIIGAGIVGCALAEELTRRGWTDVTVLERGPLFAAGGSSSHAPGLVFQTNPSRTMAALAAYTVRKYSDLGVFDRVGGLEVATTPERLGEIRRRHGFATACGIEAQLVTGERAADLFPPLDRETVLGALHTPGDGLVHAVAAGEAQARLAVDRGARFVPRQRVVAIDQAGGRVTGVRTEDGTAWPADVVVSCAGFWGPAIGALAGQPVPLLPMAHQYARTGPLHLEGRLPILRHQDRDLYVRGYDDHLGIGSYSHRPMPVTLAQTETTTGPMPSMLPFTPDDFAPAFADARALLPGLPGIAHGFNGVFSFTADGFPLLGESRELRGFWLAEAIWVTHSAGAARAVAEWLVDGRPGVDLHEADLQRFEEPQLAPDFVAERSARSFVEVYDVIHPLDPPAVARPLRVSPFHQRQRELGAVFGEASGWERPLWYEANAGLPRPELPARDEWSARFWSPIAAGEARAAREGVALFDMTSLKRLAVTGPGAAAYLNAMTSNDVDRPVGTVTYTLLLDTAGGIRSDLTVARLAEDRFQVGANGNLDLDHLARHAPPGVQVADLTPGTCCLGLWGPRARELAASITGDDLGFGYFRARRAHLGGVPVTMLRVSYVGEPGWELYTGADLGLRLWDVLWRAGVRYGLVAAGRSAFTSLRLEKGYRAWGVDMTTEHDPYEAGLGFAVKPGDYVGHAAISGKKAPVRRLTCLLIDGDQVVMGKEPVLAGGAVAGYVTSAAWGYTIGRSIAYAWLPTALAAPGTPVEIGYFGTRVPATVTAEPLFDPKGSRLRD
ncbi:GcvT family protein [Catenuloplanes indicus]|uniref:Glycine cleavage system aminomethyltransferase T/glycine/D-amino acid oxidase-like deaminating enzyme n=1 Tax=Catenuloplanes indicus TaxID=137267 RepID=A0AAE3VYV2_9ACTN|nr:FAD-dependent oxidoreductase [Catenuloplanes indicus]MDQ0365714.1 glycine cleavage system aminomethyltransferase T/glycine/D-amino acid oxidase-like deaminating enzyme [Catenuloplanes indicus]